MMKKIQHQMLWTRLALVVLLLFVFEPVSHSLAANSIQLYMNGKQLQTETAPRIVNDNLMVPLRVIAEELGATIQWEGATRTVTVQRQETTIGLQIDNDIASVNESSAKLPIAPMIMDGSTMLPLRFVGENLGVSVTWDGMKQSVYLFRAEPQEELAVEPVQVLPPAHSSLGTAVAEGIITKQNGPINLLESVKEAKPPLPSAASNQTAFTLTRIEAVDDRIELHTGADITPSMFYLDNPDRLVIDLPGVTVGASVNGKPSVQNMALEIDHPSISQARYALFSSKPTITRIVLDLKEKAEYEIAPTVAGIASLVMKAPEPPKKPRSKVVIDAGHGGSDIGAEAVSGKVEKEFTLSLSMKLYDLLKNDPDIEPVMTRSNDTFVDLSERPAVAAKEGAKLFISIHGNSYDKDNRIRGLETYYYNSSSLSLANIVHRHVLKASGFPDRKVKQGKYKVLRESPVPAILVEIGFLSNKTEEKLMYTDEVQQRIAESLAAAIREYVLN
jgi:N-acetylmuramoyl-L-alanine amidase